MANYLRDIVELFSGGYKVDSTHPLPVSDGATTDTPYDGAESATARSGISLLKGIKNYIRSIYLLLLGADLTPACNICAAAGNNTVISAPGAGFRIVVVGYLIQNESAVDTTILIKDGSTTVRRLNTVNKGDGEQKTFGLFALWRLAENSALILNLSGANQIGYTIEYYTESV